MRILGWLIIFFICFVSGGATCTPRTAPIPFPPPPVVLNTAPSLEQITNVVNRTQGIRQLSTNSATVKMVSMPSLPRLNATVNLEREKNFRLRASLPIVMGPGMDMGSNAEVFWFEVPEGISKTLYYARHDQYRQQLERAILPVDPSWLMDALGLVQIDPSNVDAGPVQRSDGRYEISSMISMPDGVYHRICFIEPNAGYVTDQYLYSPLGRLIAESHASNHAYYEQYQCALPHVVEIKLSPNVGPPLEMRIEVGAYTVNQLLSGDPNLFAIPTSASNMVDLTTLSGNPDGGIQPQPSNPVTYSAQAESGYPMRGLKR
ncbi:MAG: hypothetical protein OSA98_11165 [Rubripirellula sp.]|nr:hypothetical protein [Rubripirellula sp.]